MNKIEEKFKEMQIGVGTLALKITELLEEYKPSQAIVAMELVISTIFHESGVDMDEA